jgi:hypothetical protein
MRRDSLPIEMTQLVSPRTLRAYAEGLGWQRVETINGPIAVYANPQEPLRQIIVPLDEQLDDYADRIAEAVGRLAEFEKRTPREVLNDLLLPPADVLRFREVSAETEAGILPLDRGVRFVTGVRKMLLALAHSVLTPRPFHLRMSRAEAEEFVSRCRLGPSERGSFVLTIACPLEPQANELLEPHKEPFARRVTSLLMTTLRELSKGADRLSLEELTNVQQYAGLSANLCESLLMLKPPGERDYLIVSATWSRSLLPPAQGLPYEVKLRQEAFEIAEALAWRLRSSPQPRLDRFFGFVDELRGSPGATEPRPSGEVRLTLIYQEEEIHAKADLDVESYAEAIAAHASSQPVSFKGILHRHPRLSRIENIADFRRLRLDDSSTSAGGPSPPP